MTYFAEFNLTRPVRNIVDARYWADLHNCTPYNTDPHVKTVDFEFIDESRGYFRIKTRYRHKFTEQENLDYAKHILGVIKNELNPRLALETFARQFVFEPDGRRLITTQFDVDAFAPTLMTLEELDPIDREFAEQYWTYQI